MSESINIAVTLTTNELDRELADTEDRVDRANLAMLTAIRQTAQAGILVIQLAGIAVDQIFLLYVESLIVGLEVAFAVEAGTFGISNVLQVGQIIAMLILIRQIKTKQTAAATKTNAAVQLLRMSTFR